MTRLMSRSNASEGIVIDELLYLFHELGITEQEPKKRKHLRFENLDNKSMRIMNRFTQYIIENKVTVNVFLGDAVYTKMIKTKKTLRKDDLVLAENFYRILKEHGIRKSDE
jgi:hypothetical protein